MKKIKRILLLLFCCTVLFFCSWGSIEEFRIYNIINKLKKDPSLLILIHFNISSIFSILFGITKFKNIISIASKTYKILRISDLIFSTTSFIILCVGTHYVIKNPTPKGFEFYLIVYSIIVLLIFFSVVLFTDNILYHKSQKLLVEKDNIDEIGE